MLEDASSFKSKFDSILGAVDQSGVWYQADIAPPSPSVLFSNVSRKSKKAGYYSKLGDVQLEAINRLSSSAWLKDLEINDYIKSVASKHPNRSICVLHSQYFPNGILSEQFFNKITTLNSKSSERKQLLSAELILCPISISDTHWYLMAITKSPLNNKIVIRCLDGLNNFGAHVDLFESGKKLIEGLYGASTETLDFDMKSAQVLKQKGGNDCGVVISYYAANFCEDPELFSETDCSTEGTCDYSQFRKEMIDELNECAYVNRIQDSLEKRRSYSVEPLSPSAAQLTPVRLKAY